VAVYWRHGVRLPYAPASVKGPYIKISTEGSSLAPSMADPTPSAEPDPVTVIGPTTYDFAVSLSAIRGKHVVYLDFVQRDAHHDDLAHSVARVVMPLGAIPAAIEELSSVRDAAE
jgi:hypothetical protein